LFLCFCGFFLVFFFFYFFFIFSIPPAYDPDASSSRAFSTPLKQTFPLLLNVPQAVVLPQLAPSTLFSPNNFLCFFLLTMRQFNGGSASLVRGLSYFCDLIRPVQDSLPSAHRPVVPPSFLSYVDLYDRGVPPWIIVVQYTVPFSCLLLSLPTFPPWFFSNCFPVFSGLATCPMFDPHLA